MLLVNKQAVAIAFGRAAQNYFRHNELQRRSANGLLTLLKKKKFKTVLDAGCGPGSNSLFWRREGSQVIALDLSYAMLIQARKRKSADIYLTADIEALPLADKKFDLVWCHLAIQWCSSLSKALANLYRVTCSGGKIAFTTLLVDSLHELNQAWLSVDKRPHTNRFLIPKDIENILSPWKYRRMIQIITLYFDSAKSAMLSLKGIGATHLHYGRDHKLLTRKQLYYLEDNWPKRPSGDYPLTYQLFHGVIERD